MVWPVAPEFPRDVSYKLRYRKEKEDYGSRPGVGQAEVIGSDGEGVPEGAFRGSGP